MKEIQRKIIVISMFVIYIFICTPLNIYASDQTENDITASLAESVNINDYISKLQEYIDQNNIEGIDMNELTDSLMKTGKIDYKNLCLKLLTIFSSDLIKTISGAVSIFAIIIIMSVINALEVDEQSDIAKLSYLVCYLAVVVIMFDTFCKIIVSFKNVISILTTLMQVISPFLLAVIMATGKVSSVGIIKPMILFLASAIGFIINYIVLPFITISVSLNIISNLSENLNLSKMSKLFSSASIWVITVTLTIFLGVLSLETTLTTSVDTLAIKATQTAVSNFVPVVGKFFSDSFETVLGATHVIANVSGFVGIIAIFVVSIIPILKIFGVMLVYMILASIAQPICSNVQVVKFVSNFANTYKTLLGIMIGVAILFIISIGIILNIASNLTT